MTEIFYRTGFARRDSDTGMVTEIECVQVSEDENGKRREGSSEWRTKEQIVSDMQSGIAYTRPHHDYGLFNEGPTLRTFNVDGIDYIRTDQRDIPKDNLP